MGRATWPQELSVRAIKTLPRSPQREGRRIRNGTIRRGRGIEHRVVTDLTGVTNVSSRAANFDPGVANPQALTPMPHNATLSTLGLDRPRTCTLSLGWPTRPRPRNKLAALSRGGRARCARRCDPSQRCSEQRDRQCAWCNQFHNTLHVGFLTSVDGQIGRS